MKVTVLGGAGAWGFALSKLLTNNGHSVTIWSKFEADIEHLTNTNSCKAFPSVTLPEGTIYTSDLERATTGCDIIIIAISSPFVREVCKALNPFLKKNQIIVNVSKAIEPGTLLFLTEVIQEECPVADVAVLSGPSHAEEVVYSLPTTVVIGATTEETAHYLQNIFMSSVFRVYTSPDIKGIEAGASLKNVIALAVGISEGLGYGDNAKAAIMTRGMNEITKLGMKMGGQQLTFLGLSGMGDLIVTCSSRHSRNRRAGILIGEGKTIEETKKEVGEVIEGLNSAQAALALGAKYHVQLPIIEAINDMLNGETTPSLVVDNLMSRDRKIEHSDISW